MKKRTMIMMILGIFLYACYVSVNAYLYDAQATIPILGFHHVVHDEEKERYYQNNIWVDSESAFEEKIQYLYEQGYETWTMAELYDWKIGKKEKNGKVVVLTFDDGYFASSELIAPILKKYGFQGTTFVIGAYVEEAHIWNGSIIQYVNKEDMQDQSVMQYYSHTYALHEKINGQYKMDVSSKSALQNDLDLQKEITDITYLAYPYGHYNETMIAVLKENGTKLAFGYHENKKATRNGDFYTIPRFSIHAATSMDSFKAMLASK